MKASTVLGALIGERIDRRDGDSGVGGAIVGMATVAAVRVLLPIALTFAIGYGVRRLARTAWRDVAGHEKSAG